MQTVDSIAIEFNSNATRIASTLNEHFNLLHAGQVDHLNDPLLRWLDFRLRFIDPRPRQVHLSDRFPKTLDATTASALQTIKVKIEQGDDINMYQGVGLTKFDSSGEVRATRTDLLWADWGIHHLHLNVASDPRRSYFSKRADFLLFALFGVDCALFIDVLPHRGHNLFSREELIGAVARNWPEVLERFRIKGVVAANPEFTDLQRQELRRAGLDALLIIGDKPYFAPGGGITSASTPGAVTDSMFRLKWNLRNLAQHVLDPNGQFLTAVPEPNRDRSHFSLALSPQGLIIFERETNQGWTFPEAKGDGTDSLFAQVSDCLTPAWVTEALRTAHEQSMRQ